VQLQENKFVHTSFFSCRIFDNGGLGPALQVHMCVPSLPFLKDKVLLVIGLSPAILPTIQRQTCEIWYFLQV
jgi:hypothetical protein